jgi:hypothetical protein
MLTTSLLLLFSVIAVSSIMLDRAWTESARLRLLVALGDALRAAATAEEIVEAARKYGRSLFSGCDGALYLTRASSQIVHLAGWWGSEPAGADFAAARVARTFEQHDPSMTCLRLRADGRTLGYLTLAPHDGDAAGPGKAAVVFGDKLSQALAMVRLRESLDESARHFLTLTHAIHPGDGRDAA